MQTNKPSPGTPVPEDRLHRGQTSLPLGLYMTDLLPITVHGTPLVDTQDITDSPDCPSPAFTSITLESERIPSYRHSYKGRTQTILTTRGNRRVRRRTLDVEIAAADSRIGSCGSYGTDCCMCCEAMIPQGTKMTKAFVQPIDTYRLPRGGGVLAIYTPN